MKLAGITRPGASTPLRNPNAHSGLWGHNRVQAEVVGPDGTVRQRFDRKNIMCTSGLNSLAALLATDTNGATRWCSAMAIGTGTTAANSTQDALGGSTQIVYMSQASMAATYAGPRTLQFNGTFASNGNAAAINEVGLFATNNASQNMIARSVLGTDSINRGSADEIRISYQVIFGTA